MIDTEVSQAIVQVLKECVGKPLAVRPLATFCNGYTRAQVTPAVIQEHIDDLERKGYVQRTASPLNHKDLSWSLTEAGKLL
jgi:DNA-binding HxlR family transcriptional regulator